MKRVIAEEDCFILILCFVMYLSAARQRGHAPGSAQLPQSPEKMSDLRICSKQPEETKPLYKKNSLPETPH